MPEDPRPPDFDETFARVDALIARGHRHLPAPSTSRPVPEPPKAFLTICPLCSTALELGQAKVHGTLLGFLLVGLSYQHCWFASSRDGKERIVVPSGGSRPSCRCPPCGFVAIKADDA